MYFYTCCRQPISPANDGDARIQRSAWALPKLGRNCVVGEIGMIVLDVVSSCSNLKMVAILQATHKPRPGVLGFGLAAKRQRYLDNIKSPGSGSQ